jgi:hypothetical protein
MIPDQIRIFPVIKLMCHSERVPIIYQIILLLQYPSLRSISATWTLTEDSGLGFKAKLNAICHRIQTTRHILHLSDLTDPIRSLSCPAIYFTANGI